MFFGCYPKTLFARMTSNTRTLMTISSAVGKDVVPIYTFFGPILDDLHGIRVKVQPISTVHPPNHARTAAEMPNRRNCQRYFRTACTAA